MKIFNTIKKSLTNINEALSDASLLRSRILKISEQPSRGCNFTLDVLCVSSFKISCQARA